MRSVSSFRIFILWSSNDGLIESGTDSGISTLRESCSSCASTFLMKFLLCNRLVENVNTRLALYSALFLSDQIFIYFSPQPPLNLKMNLSSVIMGGSKKLFIGIRI